MVLGAVVSEVQRGSPRHREGRRTYGDRVTFVGVAAQDQLPAMRDFASKHGTDAFVNLNDADAAIWARFGVTYQPAYAFVDADGKIEVVKNQLPAEELESRLKALAG